jgi:hypothetical protein
MAVNADDLVPFKDVRIIRSTASALLCRIADRNVWLPRGHVSGKLWCTGDRGRLFIRRWVAHDRQLFGGGGAATSSPVSSMPRSRGRARLHVVRSEPAGHHAG